MPRSPLLQAYYNDHKEAMKLLMLHGARADDVMTAIITPRYGVSADHTTTMLKLILEHGADPNNMKTYFNGTNIPINRAILLDNKTMIEILLDHGADIEICDPSNDNKTPLEIACLQNRLSIFKYLIKRGAHVDKSSDTLLRLASNHSTKHIMFEYILKQGLSTPTTDTLEHVLIESNIHCATMLLDKGIDPNILKIGTQIKLPSRAHASNVLRLLQSYGATGLMLSGYNMYIKRIS